MESRCGGLGECLRVSRADGPDLSICVRVLVVELQHFAAKSTRL
jgi:hypothetical protein